MKDIEITDKVGMGFPVRDTLSAINMWNDIGSVIKGIQLKDVQKEAVLTVKPTLQEVTHVAYVIYPERCAIVGYTPMGSDNPDLMKVVATDIPGGVKLSGRVLITGQVDVTIYYKQVIEGTARVITPYSLSLPEPAARTPRLSK